MVILKEQSSTFETKYMYFDGNIQRALKKVYSDITFFSNTKFTIGEYSVICEGRDIYKDIDVTKDEPHPYLYRFFNGLYLLFKNEEFTQSPSSIEFLEYKVDQDIMDKLVENSEYKDLLNYSFYILTLDGNHYILDSRVDNYAQISPMDSIYAYINYSMTKGENISYYDWIKYQYYYQVRDFTNELSQYNLIDNVDSSHILDTIVEDSNLLGLYDYFTSSGYSPMRYIINTLYENGVITLTTKETLLNMNEDVFDELCSDIRQKIDFEYKKFENNIIGKDEYIVIVPDYSFYDNMYISEYTIKEWIDNYKLDEWLTYDILSACTKNSDLDPSLLLEMIEDRNSYEDNELELQVVVYIRKEHLIEILNDSKYNELGVSNRKGLIPKTMKLFKTEVNPDKDPKVVSYEKKIQYIDSNVIYRMASILGKYIDYNTEVKITIPQLKKIASKDKILSNFISSKDVDTLLKSKSSGFTISELKDINFYPYKKNSLFSYFKETGLEEREYLSIDVVSYKWKSSLQSITNKPNYVFQLNLRKKYLEEIIAEFKLPKQVVKSLEGYHKVKHSVHPVQNNNKYITLGWIRYTINPTIKSMKTELDGVLLDEIQSDLDNFEYLGRDIMNGWQNVLMRRFIAYVKKNLGYTKIYLPTKDSKVDDYHAFQRDNQGNIVQKYTAELLYQQLPKSFGFKPSEYKSFNLLEKRIINIV